MGWILNLIFYALVGLAFAFIAHTFFGVPYGSNTRGIFFLGFFIAIIVDYLMSEADSLESVLSTVFWVLAGAAFVYFIVWPFFISDSNASPDIPSPPDQVYPSTTIVDLPSVTATPIEYYTRTYHWTYGGHSPTYTIKIPKPLYEYYQQQPHDRNIAKYALSSTDRKVLEAVISDFKENTDSKTEAAHQVVAFVQSLPYFKDKASTGYDEYPRYPIETLVDNGGDCEDTAILTAALLKEMNYDVVLISPPGHMAVGITCPACKGTYYTYNNKKYYYLETTGNNWKVGQLPPDYKNLKVKIYPI